MAIKLNNIWQLWLLKGILFIVFGIIALIWPAMTLVILALIFALLILFSGISSLVIGIISIDHAPKYWFLTILIGILEIGVSIYAFSHLGMSIAALVFLIAFVFIGRSILEIISAFDETYSNSRKVLLVVSGLLGIIAGIIILKYPIAGSLAFFWILGVYALIAGSIYIALSMMIKRTIGDLTRSV